MWRCAGLRASVAICLDPRRYACKADCNSDSAAAEGAPNRSFVLMTHDLPDTIARLRASAAEFDHDGVEDGIERLQWFTDDDGTWGVELFAAVKSLLTDAAFLNSGKSYRLVMELTLDWDELSARQHEELRPLLAAAFDRFGDFL